MHPNTQKQRVLLNSGKGRYVEYILFDGPFVKLSLTHTAQSHFPPANHRASHM